MDEQNTTAATRCWIDGNRVCLELDDQRQVSFPASKYPLLSNATTEKLSQVELQLNGRALRWEKLDEDILVEDVLLGNFPKPKEAALA
jgi:hypothetical protein